MTWLCVFRLRPVSTVFLLLTHSRGLPPLPSEDLEISPSLLKWPWYIALVARLSFWNVRLNERLTSSYPKDETSRGHCHQFLLSFSITRQLVNKSDFFVSPSSSFLFVLIQLTFPVTMLQSALKIELITADRRALSRKRKSSARQQGNYAKDWGESGWVGGEFGAGEAGGGLVHRKKGNMSSVGLGWKTAKGKNHTHW